MNDIERIKLNRAIDEMLRNSIAESPRQAATLRELVLDAIEEAGFEIVGKNLAAPSSTAGMLKIQKDNAFGCRNVEVSFSGAQGTGKTLLSLWLAVMLRDNNFTVTPSGSKDGLFVTRVTGYPDVYPVGVMGTPARTK